MFDVTHLLMTGGLLLFGAIIFAEVGLFLGFFLPGDTLVIAAGVYAHQGHFSIISVLAVCAIAAIAGDSLGYFIGRRLGPTVFNRQDSVLFRPDHVRRAHDFFEKHGPKTLLISHFLPVIRSFTPLLAGVSAMPYRKFLAFNVVGDLLWAVSVSLLGYYVGSRIKHIDTYIMIALVFVIAVGLIPTLYHLGRIQLRKRRGVAANSSKSDK
jgi:membrane-associated protein